MDIHCVSEVKEAFPLKLDMCVLSCSASSCSLTPLMNRQGTPMQLNAPLEGRPFRGPPAARPGSAPPGVAWGGHGSRERRRCGRRAASIF